MAQFATFVFAIASVSLGIADLALNDQLISNWQLPGAALFLIGTSIALVLGGVALTVSRTQRLGAAIVTSVYGLFAITFVPDVFAHPGIYASWGNIFYQLAPASGALAAYCLVSPGTASNKYLSTLTVLLLGASNASFAIEQIEFLARTASLVPAWVPLGGTFWTIVTTFAFALAAIAIVSGYRSILAAQLSATMLAAFVIAIWIPMLIADPKSHTNWSEGLETLAIAGATWIVADLLRMRRLQAE